MLRMEIFEKYITALEHCDLVIFMYFFCLISQSSVQLLEHFFFYRETTL